MARGSQYQQALIPRGPTVSKEELDRLCDKIEKEIVAARRKSSLDITKPEGQSGTNPAAEVGKSSPKMSQGDDVEMIDQPAQLNNLSANPPASTLEQRSQAPAREPNIFDKFLVRIPPTASGGLQSVQTAPATTMPQQSNEKSSDEPPEKKRKLAGGQTASPAAAAVPTPRSDNIDRVIQRVEEMVEGDGKMLRSMQKAFKKAEAASEWPMMTSSHKMILKPLKAARARLDGNRAATVKLDEAIKEVKNIMQ